MKYITKIATALLFAGLSSSVFMAPAQALEAADKPEIEKIIREYLLKNPEILGEMQAIYEARQKAEQVANQKKALEEKADIIFSSKYQVEIGNKDAKYKVVEFFDYNCPFCQRAMADMEKILEASPDVKFVLKEWPVLGQNSYEAHTVSIAFTALMPEKYNEFHLQLLGSKGQKGERKAIEIALSLGVDEKLLRQEMAKPYILETLREVNSIASDLGITGTPSYVIGDEVVFGAVGFNQINSRLEALMNKPAEDETETSMDTPAEDMTAEYMIKAGDSLWNIAKMRYGDAQMWINIEKANDVNNVLNLKIGRILKLPK